jgi:hypothetical protein
MHLLDMGKDIESLYPTRKNDIYDYYGNGLNCYQYDALFYEYVKERQAPLEEADFIIVPYYHGWFQHYMRYLKPELEKHSYLDEV